LGGVPNKLVICEHILSSWILKKQIAKCNNTIFEVLMED